jgi:epoxide hydrolase 4
MTAMVPAQLAVEHRYLTVNALRMHSVEKGRGPLVLLLHGFPEHWWTWRYQIDPLARAGFRVVAPDLRGYGETAGPGPYDLRTVTRDVSELIRALGEDRAIVVGHDWGGALAWTLAANHPEQVERLIVINCPHPAQVPRAILRSPDQALRLSYFFFFQLPWLPERALKKDGATAIRRMYRGNALDKSRFSDEEIQPFRDAILRPGAATAMLGWYRAAVRGALAGPRLTKIRVPTLMIWGMQDRALRYEHVVPGTEHRVEDLRIERIEGCGHFAPAEQPERVNALLLDAVSASRSIDQTIGL